MTKKNDTFIKERTKKKKKNDLDNMILEYITD